MKCWYLRLGVARLMLMVPCVVGNLEFIMSSWPHHVRISLLWWEIIDTEIVYWGSLYHCQCVLTAFMNSVGPVEIATHNDSIFFARHCLFLLLNVTSQAHTTHPRVQGYSYRLHSEISIVWPIPKVLNNLFQWCSALLPKCNFNCGSIHEHVLFIFAGFTSKICPTIMN